MMQRASRQPGSNSHVLVRQLQEQRAKAIAPAA
jgi:hypothetical protein